MITKLTPQQEKLMEEVREEWLDRLFSCKNVEIDREEAIKSVDWLYRFCGLKKPKVIVLDSPLAMQYGSQASSQVRAQVRAQVRSQVRAQVSSQVWAQVSSQVSDQVSSQVSDQVESQVSSQVWDQVESQVSSQVWDQVSSQVSSQVRSQVRSQVSDQVWDQVESQVEDFIPFCFHGSVADYSWVSFYDFFDRILKLRDDSFDRFKKLLKTGIYDMIQFNNLCIVGQMPIKISRDDNKKLNNYDDMAIKWADGYGQYYIHGVSFDRDLFTQVTRKDCLVKKVLGLENIEQRMVCIKMKGTNWLLENSNAELLDKSERGNELFLIKGLFSHPAYYLKYFCPSTKREYVSGVDPEIGKLKDADKAMAWKFSLTQIEYNNLERET